MSFAERTPAMAACVPEVADSRLAEIRRARDPQRLLLAAHLPSAR